MGNTAGGCPLFVPDDLLAHTYKALAERTKIDAAELDEIFAGCGNQAGEDNRDVARMSSLLAGFPKEVPGITVNRNCSSALGAVNLAARSILSGEGNLYIGSGVGMSRAPWSMPKPLKAPTTAPPKIYDTTVGWRYENPKMNELYPIISLGEGAELIAEDMQITREEQDAFALESHARAITAINKGRFKDEIVAVTVPQRKGEPLIIDTDEHPRYDRTNGHLDIAIDMAALGQLRPAFKKDGSVTAGNSSGINDGAAALLMSSRLKADDLGLNRCCAGWGQLLSELIPVTSAMGQSLRRRNFLSASTSKSMILDWSSSMKRSLRRLLGVCGNWVSATTTPTLMAGPLPWATLLAALARVSW